MDELRGRIDLERQVRDLENKLWRWCKISVGKLVSTDGGLILKNFNQLGVMLVCGLVCSSPHLADNRTLMQMN